MVSVYDGRNVRVKEERQRLGLTQQAAADKCGVHRVQWGRYERGEQGFDGEVLRNFAKAGADSTYILSGVRSNQDEMDTLRILREGNVVYRVNGVEQDISDLAVAVALNETMNRIQDEEAEKYFQPENTQNLRENEILACVRRMSKARQETLLYIALALEKEK